MPFKLENRCPIRDALADKGFRSYPFRILSSTLMARAVAQEIATVGITPENPPPHKPTTAPTVTTAKHLAAVSRAASKVLIIS
jgi:hypothetical protein